mgnify:CR=1
MAPSTAHPHDPSCIFCQIVRGEAPASIAYEDEQALAFMDINPLSRGHLLVIPRMHAPDLFALPDRVAGHLFVVARRMALALRESHRPDGISVVQSNGRAAGQVVFHLHIHLIPRRLEGGGPQLSWNRLDPRPTRAELDEDARRIREAAAGLPPSQFP